MRIACSIHSYEKVWKVSPRREELEGLRQNGLDLYRGIHMASSRTLLEPIHMKILALGMLLANF